MKKILIVDDCPETRALIHFALTRENYEVIEASNGENALIKAIQEIPDLIVLDIVMPRVDGFSTAVKLKENTKTENIPIIIASSKGGLRHLFELNKTLQVVDFIEKPFRPETLLEKIKNILE
ncbi:MAG: response regulator [Elusimicrobia bacterium]|nr:response regulator [Elusimicrobiota bacterium]